MDKERIIKTFGEEDISGFLRSVFAAAIDSIKQVEYLSNDRDRTYKYCIETLGLIVAMNNIGKLGIEIPKVTGEVESDIRKIKELFVALENASAELLFISGTNNDKEFIERERGSAIRYSLTKENADRTQQLINELRDIVNKTNSISDEHKLRLLRKLERLQMEFHKKESDFDRFWGFVGEIGPVIGKFGRDVKPFTDRLRELVDIVTKTQSDGQQVLDNKENSLPDKSDDHKNNG